ncbi:MAG: hypothetical protein GFH27_549279n439 [Chloroflexi bacterium AL-W]|nr:hypothetical protein [Chloroflexi bacterium AL-N1]NOK65405.1 hypothetical protein [Chloroflexi bacterium AL-N10]NOK72329.1 hypothetical protein [Chloroflexi bacterium AL-N5]NOK79584.1 hypothetical protein [Chloroflexi bacterium AL-W]NOK87500.1 hypothetical protein [Chloroflexi bacterium AL-N15]
MMKRIAGLLSWIVLGSLLVGGQGAVSAQPPATPSTGDCRADIEDAIDELVDTVFDQHTLPGMTLAVTQDGEIVCEKGYGVRRADTNAPMQPYTISRIGSVNKVLTTLGMMHLIEETPGLGITSGVYTNILNDSDYENAYTQGVRRHYPVIGQAIGNNNNTVTWYSNGTYTIGSSSDLDSIEGPQPFTLPAPQDMNDVLGIARGGPDNHVYSWYRDGTYSVGTPDDLGSVQSFAGTYESNRRDTIVGVALDKQNGYFYAYYHDGTMTSGTSPDDLKSRWDGETLDYTVPVNQLRRYDIVDVARTVNGRSIVWFSDDQASRGSASDLGEDTGLYDVVRPDIPGERQYWIDEYESIQIRHLLSHTSGLWGSGDVDQAVIKYQWDDWDENFNQLPYKDTHRYVLSTRPLQYEPGTDYDYSNHGMGLVGHVIEELTGEDWYDYLHDNVLIPSGAGAIRPFGSIFVDESPDRVANPHTLDGDGNLVVGTYPQQNHSGSAAGSLMASAGDLARVMLATDRDPTTPDVMDAATLAVMETRWFDDAAPNRTLGWSVDCQSSACSDQRRLWHNGVVDDGVAFMARYDSYERNGATIDGIGVAIVVNRGNNDSLTSRLSTLSNDVAEVVALTEPIIAPPIPDDSRRIFLPLINR